MGIAVGSRAHLEEESLANRTFFRTLLMQGFHALVYVLCVRGIKDTQVRLSMCVCVCVCT